MVRIVPALSADDMAQVRSLFQEYAAGLGVDLCFQGFAAELAGLPGAYAPPGGALFIARAADQPAGTVALRSLGAGTCEMKRLYVRPAFRRQGLGRRLALEVIAAGRRIGYERMRLDTLARMEPAIGLYSALGFKRIEPYCANPIQDAVFFELAL